MKRFKECSSVVNIHYTDIYNAVRISFDPMTYRNANATFRKLSDMHACNIPEAMYQL